MKISIVIPVYNEADRLGACLEAIAGQTVAPDEVIVVDNNSTDDTVAIARRYPFVTVVCESRQGVVYARDRGFDAARGDIIGRLDADSIIAPNWVATVLQLFAADAEVAAITGSVSYYGLAFSSFLDAVDLKIRRRLARLLGREVALQGANMALRASAWRAVRSDLCRLGNMHEDFDLAVHLTRADFTLAFNERLQAAIDCRRLEVDWLEFCKYAWLSPSTYAKHKLKSQRHMYPVVMLVILFYPALRLLHGGFNRETGRFSLRTLLNFSAQGRVNPATFVD